MRTRPVLAIVAFVVVIVGAQSPHGQAPAAASDRAPRNAAEFDTMFQQIKNWGRWGANDQLGSANLADR